MQKDILWSPWSKVGLEHLQLSTSQGEIRADGLIIATHEQVPYRLHYILRCDSNWKLRSAHLHFLNETESSISLLTDGQGNWTSDTGTKLPPLKGCLDIDISATPFTNTLPIRRLSLAPGESALLKVAYVQVPQMQISVTEQRYTCLQALTPEGGKYKFESLEEGKVRFTAELPVDGEGLVLDYPHLFLRKSSK